MEWIYGEFINKVAEGRKLEADDVRKIAGGRVWSGREAVKLGLVDELGGLDAAIAHAAEAAALGKNYDVVEFPQTQTFAEMLTSWLENVRPMQTKQSSLVSQVTARVEEQVKVLQQYNDPRGIYARMPLDIQVR